MKRKILIITFACKPNGGSESGVGWNYANLIRECYKDDEVYLLAWAGENQKELLTKSGANFNYIFYDLPDAIVNLQIKQTSTGYKFMEVYYLLWQLGALKYIKNFFGNDYFDLVHHVTFVSATLPSFFVFLHAKFVWGPLSSNDLVPKELGYSKKTYYKFLIRDVIKRIYRRVSFTFNIDKVKSSGILVNTQDISKMLNLKRDNVFVIPSIGIEKPNENITAKKFKENEEINIVSIGEFLDIKNFDLTIEAFYKYNKINRNSKLYLIGDGVKRSKYQNMVKQLGIQEQVIFTGWLKRAEVLSFSNMKAHILLFPTCEKAGMVILEAMSYAIPVVGLNFGGPKEFTNKECGELVNITSRDQITNELASAMIKIESNYSKYSQAALKHVEKYYWGNRIVKLKEIYTKIIG